MINIRVLKKEELPKLFKIAETFHSITEVIIPFMPEVFVAKWTELIDNNQGEILVGKREDGSIAGTVGYITFPDINSNQLVGTEMFWFVEPASRNTSLGGRLIKEYEKRATDKGCKRLYITHLKDSMPERLKKFYIKLGYFEVETHYGKEIK